MKLYLNDEKTPVDPRPLNNILWELKALCASVTYFDKLPMRKFGMSKSLKPNFDILFVNEEA